MTFLFNRDWTPQEILKRVGSMDQLAGIRALEAADGTARGSRMFQVWTGSGLSFNVLADRALDISACRYKDIPLAWASSPGDVHPAYYEPQGLGWLRSFQGGLLVTCGLDHFGPPSDDKGETFGIHGRIGNLPARYVGHRAYWTKAGDYELEISGEVRQTRVFGENLTLRRRISTRLGSNTIRIADVVTNEGFCPQPHMILYHFNLGFPLLSEDTRLHINAQESVARDEDAEAGLSDWQRFQPPASNYREQVFRHTPQTGDDGKAQAEIENPRLGLGLRLTYKSVNLPYLLEWKMMGEGIYVLGIEPVNCGVMGGRAAARESGDLPSLEPGEERCYKLELEVIEYPQEA